MVQVSKVFVVLFASSSLASMAGMELLGALCIIMAVGFLIRGRTCLGALRTGIDIEIFYLLFVCLVGFLIGEWSALRFELFSQFRWIFLFYALYLCITEIDANDAILPIFRALAILVILLGTYALFQNQFGIDLVRGGQGKVQNFKDSAFRAVGTFSNPITFGNSMAMVSCLLFSGVIYLKGRDRILVGLAFLLGCLAVFVSYTRGAYIGLILGVASIAVASGRRMVRSLVIASVAGGLLILAIDSEFTERIKSIFYLSSSSLSRFYIWKAHLAMFLEHPLFGVGYNFNAWAVEPYFKSLAIPEQYWQFSHAHNNIIQFLGGTGITGTLGYIWLTSSIFRLNVRGLFLAQEPKAKALTIGVLGVHTAFFASGLTEATFRDSELRNLFILCLALYLSAYNNGLKSKVLEAKAIQ